MLRRAMASESPVRRGILQVLWWALFVTCLVLFVIHFTFVEVTNLPLNPLQVEFAPAMDPWLHPLFQQNWNFFAPQPVDRDVTVLARTRACATSQPRCLPSSWSNISSPLIDAVRRDRVGSLSLIELMLANAANEFSNRASAASQRMHRAVLGQVDDAVDPLDAVIILRTSAAALKAESPRQRFAGLQFALHVYQFPRFSRRDEPNHPQSGKLVTTNWVPFPNDIATFQD